MIVDVHTHAPRFRTRPAAPGAAQPTAVIRPDQPSVGLSDVYTWDDYLAGLQTVDRAICFNMAAPPKSHAFPPQGGILFPPQGGILMDDARTINDETAEFVRAHPDKFIGFMSVHPDDPAMLDEVDRSVGDLGLRGIKLSSTYQRFDELSDNALRLYQRAEELHLPILFHQGTGVARFADLQFGHPRQMDRIATRFPELKVIMAHVGHPWHVDCIAVIRKHPNVYADISAQFYRPWQYYNEMRLATEWSVLHKLLLGSDFPVATPRETIDAIDRVNDPIKGTGLPPVPIDELEKLIDRDSLGLLGLA